VHRLPLAHNPGAMQPVEPSSLPITSDLAKALQTHVRSLADPSLQGRKPGTQGNRAAAEYIKTRFQEAGLVPLSSLGGYGQGLPAQLGDNLLGLKPAAGTIAQAPYLLVGAHYDHLGGAYLGADDNASGVAILIEQARSLPALRRHHVLFAAFNAEEPPHIRTPQMGSQYFADHFRRRSARSMRSRPSSSWTSWAASIGNPCARWSSLLGRRRVRSSIAA